MSGKSTTKQQKHRKHLKMMSLEKNLMALSGESKKVVFHALLSHQDAGLAPSTAAAEINTSLYFHLYVTTSPGKEKEEGQRDKALVTRTKTEQEQTNKKNMGNAKGKKEGPFKKTQRYGQ